MKDFVVRTLDADKAFEIEVIDLYEQTALADYMIVASGQSNRQITRIAEKLIERVKLSNHDIVATEGMSQGDWVIVDLGDIVVHLFRPEVREFYNIEKMWRPQNPLEIVGNNTVFG